MINGIKVTFFGGMTVLLENEAGFKILVDPYFTKNPHRVRLLMISMMWI